MFILWMLIGTPPTAGAHVMNFFLAGHLLALATYAIKIWASGMCYLHDVYGLEWTASRVKVMGGTEDRKERSRDAMGLLCFCCCPHIILGGLCCSFAFAKRAHKMHREFESIELAVNPLVCCCWCCLRKGQPKRYLMADKVNPRKQRQAAGRLPAVRKAYKKTKVHVFKQQPSRVIRL
jgi:hypothetical protein